MSPGHRPLRFALLCETPRLAAWQASCLDLLLASECAELVLVITAGHGTERTAGVLGTARRSVRDRRRRLLWPLCRRHFMRRAGALEAVDCSARVAAVDRVEWAMIEDEQGFAGFADRDVATTAAYGLDFILKFGLGPLRGKILTAAWYGVWSYDHDHDHTIAAAPTGFWEVMRREPTTVVTLRRLKERPDPGVALHRATFATHWRLPTNYDQVAFGSADGCLRVCRAILVGDEPAAFGDSAPDPAKPPGNRQVGAFVFKQISGYLREKFAKQFCRDEWNVGIVDSPIEALLNQGQLRRVTWLGPKGSDVYLADPIGLETSDRCRFLAELFDYGGSAKGSIVRCDLDADGRLSVVLFLNDDCHLSYPFVLLDESGRYLIPETHEREAILIYPIDIDGVTGPPTVLLAGQRIVDATVVRHDHRWWLFGSEGSLKLLAFHAERLHGPWTPHRLNPLKTDVTSARPAGPFFERDGTLFRPAQDGSLGYGAAVVINRIVELTPERFREERVGRIGPEVDGPYPKGFHTINLIREGCLVDGKRTVLDPTWIFRGRTHGRKVRARRARLAAASQMPLDRDGATPPISGPAAQAQLTTVRQIALAARPDLTVNARLGAARCAGAANAMTIARSRAETAWRRMIELSFRQRVGILIGLLVIGLLGLMALNPIPQNPDYHLFADTRPLLGISNFNDVMSNAGFAVVGILGIVMVLGRSGRDIFARRSDAWPYLVFFIAVALVSLGSAYYHWSPSTDRLLWDRLPMAIAFMAFCSAIIADRIDRTAGNTWLMPLLIGLGLASLWYWDWTESLGRGDLRFYGFVQFYPMIAIPVVCLLFPEHRYTAGRYIAWVFAWYGISKLLEHFDAEVFDFLGHTVSGHTLKHLAAAAATLVVLRMLLVQRSGRSTP